MKFKSEFRRFGLNGIFLGVQRTKKNWVSRRVHEHWAICTIIFHAYFFFLICWRSSGRIAQFMFDSLCAMHVMDEWFCVYVCVCVNKTVIFVSFVRIIMCINYSFIYICNSMWRDFSRSKHIKQNQSYLFILIVVYFLLHLIIFPSKVLRHCTIINCHVWNVQIVWWFIF